jgi:hypothetical protein
MNKTIKNVIGCTSISPGVKWPEREAIYPHVLNTRVKCVELYPFSPPNKVAEAVTLVTYTGEVKVRFATGT